MAADTLRVRLGRYANSVVKKETSQNFDEHIQVALIAIPGIGRKTILAIEKWLKRAHVTWEEWWRDSAAQTQTLTKPQRDQLTIFQKTHTPETYAESLLARHIAWVFVHSPKYPLTLAHIPDPPHILFYKGEWQNIQFDSLMVGVVGSREMSSYGERVTRKLVAELVPLGVTIISGAMYGIDTEAHLACLQHGGMSVGVLGYGFDYCYPPDHEPVLEKLLAGGHVLVSEFAPEVAPKSQLFPVRNRIIAGWSEVLVVTEAAEKSGSLITAKAAIEYGRTVCAVPGSIQYPTTAGTRWLLNEGAVLVASGLDIWREARGGAELPITSEISLEYDEEIDGKSMADKVPKRCSPEATQIWKIVSQSGASTAELADILGWSASKLLVALAELEMKNIIHMRGEIWEVVH